MQKAGLTNSVILNRNFTFQGYIFSVFTKTVRKVSNSSAPSLNVIRVAEIKPLNVKHCIIMHYYVIYNTWEFNVRCQTFYCFWCTNLLPTAPGKICT